MHRSILLTCLLAAAVSALVTVVAIVLVRHWSGADASVLRARRFEVVDGEGRIRGYFGGPDFNDSLTLVDMDGTERASLRVLAEGTVVLYLADGANRGRTGLYVTRQGDAALQFFDENGRISGVVVGSPTIP